VTDDQRFVGKTTILGCGYGMGAAKFKAQLKTFNVDMELEECERIISYLPRHVPHDTETMASKLDRALMAMTRNKTAPTWL
jgi:hypothetical protein